MAGGLALLAFQRGDDAADHASVRELTGAVLTAEFQSVVVRFVTWLHKSMTAKRK